jgi:PPM family protein phosphatase
MNQTPFHLRVWCQTDVGLRRERNEDFFLFDEEIGLYIVADGMGGHRGGEVASRMAAETMREVLQRIIKSGGSRRLNPRVILTQAYEEASQRIFEKSKDLSTELSGMGTTLVASFAYQGTLYVANVGDSRAYLFSNGNLWQMTEDHSLMNEQLRAGVIADKDVAQYSGKNVITRSVGFEPDVQVDVIERELKAGEMVLMCSDGLSGLVEDAKIAELCAGPNPSEIVTNCIAEAKKNGGDDNITVMLVYAEPQSS